MKIIIENQMEVINTIKTYNDETKNQVRSEINR